MSELLLDLNYSFHITISESGTASSSSLVTGNLQGLSESEIISIVQRRLAGIVAQLKSTQETSSENAIK